MINRLLAIVTIGCFAGACSNWPSATVLDAGAPAAPPEVRCDPATTSLLLPARTDLFSSDGSGGAATTMATRDLFELFRSSCGACHVEGSLGGLHVTQETFATAIGQNAILRIKSDDPTVYMPPQSAGGKPFSMRAATDPVVQRMLGTSEDSGKLLGLDRAWLANAIKATGNYGEMFERNVGPKSLLGLPRGINNLWSKGGVVYPMPIR